MPPSLKWSGRSPPSAPPPGGRGRTSRDTKARTWRYLKKVYKSNKKRDDLPAEPIKYEFNGTEILVGRNNLQNDKLTLKIAKKAYTWLHTKKIHGSHVIIKSDTVSDDLLYYAATLAVKHSQAKNSSKVEVDYTLVKNVHKEIGAKPGMVVYTNYHTIIV